MRKFSYVKWKSSRREQSLYSSSSHSLNIHSVFQDTPCTPKDEEKMTRLIDDHCVAVCLLLRERGTKVRTIHGEEVGYPSPNGEPKSEIKRRILSATVKIPAKNKNCLTIIRVPGDSYTEAVYMEKTGDVYRPVDSIGVKVQSFLYSPKKGWYEC